jgi:HK97 family phage prohead protease
MVGYALRWGHPAYIFEGGQSYEERFARGAFLRSIAAGKVRLCLEHEWTDVIATQADGSLTLVEDAIGLRLDALANHSAAGDDALTAVRTRWNAGLSVSFADPTVAWQDTEAGRQRIIADCNLHEVSVCRTPCYRSSEIAAGKLRIGRFLAGLPDDRLARLECAEASLARLAQHAA